MTFEDSRLVLLVMFTYRVGSANMWELIVHTNITDDFLVGREYDAINVIYY